MNKILVIIKKILPSKFFDKLAPAYHYVLGAGGHFFYGRPSQKLIVIGVTGTTGKTSTVYLIAKLLSGAGYKVGYTSTAMFSDGNSEWLNNKKMTMVGRWFTPKILHQMVKNNCQYAVVETSSEGIRQFRHRFINYDVLVFTGLYPEHIESHGGFENYKLAKAELFKHLKKCRTKYVSDHREIVKLKSGLKKIDYQRVKKTIIANIDDAEAGYFLDFWAESKLGYGLKDVKNFAGEEELGKLEVAETMEAENISTTLSGTEFDIDLALSGIHQADTAHVKTGLLGDFNVYNALASMAVAVNQEVAWDKIKISLEAIKGVPGRLEIIDEGQNFKVLVDYAFEPRALEKLYKAIDLIPHNSIIHVLGSAGGGRDASRRPILGQMAGSKADYVIITNEDPYDDDPLAIMEAVALGAEESGKIANENLFKILDRREALKKALKLAKEDDIVLITGKGSEQFICIKDGGKITWDDRQVVREELRRL